MKSIFVTLFFIFLLSCSYLSKFEPIQTKMQFCTFGIYNTQNGWMVYNGINITPEGNITDLTISVKNINNMESDYVIENDILYPALGWVDSTHLLLYSPQVYNASFQSGYFLFDIYSKNRKYIQLPFNVKYGGFVAISENVIILKRWQNNKNEYYKYDLCSENIVGIDLLENYEVRKLIYDKNKDMFFFISSSLGNQVLYSLKENQVIFLKEFELSNDYDIDNIYFGFESNTIFYVCRVLNKQELHSFDLQSKEDVCVLSFDEGFECTCLSVYDNETLLLSLTLKGKAITWYNIESKQNNIELGLDTDMRIVKFKLM